MYKSIKGFKSKNAFKNITLKNDWKLSNVLMHEEQIIQN